MKKIILFGDSITDMGRWRDSDKHGFSFGVGYPLFLKERFIQNNIDVELLNRGCSGDTTSHLLNRLNDDVINNRPDIITILIGVNDLWHLYGGDETHKGNSVEQFEINYRKIIKEIKTNLPNCKILMFAPFILPLQNENDGLWNHLKKLPDYINVEEKIAKDNNIAFTKLQPLMDEAKKTYETKEILYDGIHPNVRGSLILADKFYEEIIKII